MFDGVAANLINNKFDIVDAGPAKPKLLRQLSDKHLDWTDIFQAARY